MYDGGSIDDNDDDVRGSRVDSGKQYRERIDLMLDLLSDSYSELNAISVGVSRPFSGSTSHHLLTIYSINYCPKERVNNFSLRKLFYSKQDLKNACCSSM